MTNTTQQILKLFSDTATGHPLMDFSLPTALITATAHILWPSHIIAYHASQIPSYQYHLILNLCADIF